METLERFGGQVALALEIVRLHREAIERERLEAANRQIQEATERKSRFLASMSHEIRTPMTAVVGYADNLLDGVAGELNEQQRRNLASIRQSADHLLGLINDILDLSKIEAGRMEVNPERFKVEKLVEACCASVSPLVRPGVALRCEVAGELGKAETDQGRLRQVLLNLLSNALKFTEKGEVVVRAFREYEQLVVSVSDTGTGIPEDKLETIFEEFQQVEGAGQKHGGTGLGLAIAKGWAELLGGTISVDSEVGKGSVFTLRVPAVYRV